MSAIPNAPRVLIVEDEYFIAQDLAEALQEAGAMVVGPAAHYDEALAAIANDGCDAAVIDLNLAGEADFRVADELARRGVPFVFATGYDAGIVPESHQQVQRFEKPYDTAEVVQCVGRMLDERGLGP